MVYLIDADGQVGSKLAELELLQLDLGNANAKIGSLNRDNVFITQIVVAERKIEKNGIYRTSST
jgi:hypothetical protein